MGEHAKVCGGCHGQDGNSTTAGVPSLAGQPKIYLENQLVLIREGLRAAEVAQKKELIGRMSDKDIIAIAAHFAALPPRTAAAAQVDSIRFQRGRQLAGKLHCGSCHSADYRGRQQMPRLAGQREEYLAATMRGYRDKPRAGGDTIMTAAVYGLPDADINALAHYLARLR